MAGQKGTKISTYLLNLPLRVNLRATTSMLSKSSEASTNGCTLGVTTGGFFIGFRMASKMSLLPSKATMCRPVPRQAVMHAPASKEIQMPYFHDLFQDYIAKNHIGSTTFVWLDTHLWMRCNPKSSLLRCL